MRGPGGNKTNWHVDCKIIRIDPITIKTEPKKNPSVQRAHFAKAYLGPTCGDRICMASFVCGKPVLLRTILKEMHVRESLAYCELWSSSPLHDKKISGSSTIDGRPDAVSILPPGHPDRRPTESLIEQSFARVYGGKILEHYPTLISICDTGQRVRAAAGVRLAREEKLFLEQYLARPVEWQLSEMEIGPIERDHIAEIGNLAANGSKASIRLFIALAEYLEQLRCTVAIVTATKRLRRFFELAGFQALPVARADSSRLPDKGASWGRYYQTDPVVLAGSIACAHERLKDLAPHSRQAPGTRRHMMRKPSSSLLACGTDI